MNMMTMYMLTRLDVLNFFFGITCFLSAFCTIGCLIFAYMEDVFNELHRAIKYSVIALIISTCGAILTPSTKQMAAIIVVPTIVNSTAVQKDVPELYNLGVEWLKDKLIKDDK
jgi:multisubunit Na+/H+ antiporter MnhG subunit